VLLEEEATGTTIAIEEEARVLVSRELGAW
jgi:hypothetical protein